ncbi:MAG: HU family DNA-binding protein, partial [Evtepia sp.]
KSRAERMGRNPKTNESIPIPAMKVPSFKASQSLKDAIDA